MSIDLLASLGITEDQFAAAKDSTVTEAFEVMPSGVVPGKIKEVILYKNKFGTETLQVNVVVKHNDAERRKNWKPREAKYKKGVLRLFSQHAASPMKGAYLEY